MLFILFIKYIAVDLLYIVPYLDSITHFFNHLNILKGCMLNYNYQNLGQSKF